MRIGSLFSGIGGLDLACEEVFGGRTVWQVEGIDLGTAALAETHPVSRKTWAKLKGYARHGEFNRRVLARHWPRARQMCDVRTVGAHNLEAVDVICGGFPCQDLSVAGTRAGLDGERSGLYREMHRIAAELRPRYVVIENVPGLLKYKARLARDFAALGYGLRWQPIAAQDVGAPHRRRRVFVVACRDWRGSAVLEKPRAGDGAAAWPTPVAADGMRCSVSFARGNLTMLGAARSETWPTPTAKIGESGPSKLGRPGHGGGALHDVVHAAWPTPTAGDAKSSGSRSLPGSGAHAGTSLADATRPDRAGFWPTPTAMVGEQDPATFDRRYAKHKARGFHCGELLGTAVRRPDDAPWPTPTTQDGSNNGAPSQAERNTAPLNAAAGGALNPAWVELLMGLPSGWTEADGEPMTWPGAHAWPAGRGAPQLAHEPSRLVESRSVPDRTLRLRSLGNGVVPHQAIEALRRCLRGPRQRDLFATL